MAPNPLLSSSLLVACALLASAPHAAAAPLHAVEGARCRAWLSQLSYDDPDGDDAELLTLRVEAKKPSAPSPFRDGPAAAPAPAPCTPPEADAGGHAPDAGGEAPEAGAPTLGDCGLSALELVNGASGACDVYRSVPLADVPVPEDGFLVLCAEDSVLAAAGLCDLTTAGRSALKNGWLQNGPADGLALVGTDGSRLELAYEGAPGCFGGGAIPLPEETGMMPGAAGEVDDVAAWCGDGFLLLPEDRAEPGEESRCPGAPGLAATDGGAAFGAGAGGTTPTAPPDAAPWTPEFAPGAGGGAAALAPWPTVFDAGPYELPASEARTPPRPPGCEAGAPAASDRGWLQRGIVLALTSLTLQRLRSRRKPPAARSRARWFARFGSSPPRSP